MGEHEKTVTFSNLIRQGVLQIGDGYRAKLEELGGDGPIFLRAGLLTESGFDWASGERFKSDLTGKLRSKIGQPGDTMVTTKGNSVGRTSYVPSGTPEFVYSPHLSYWRSIDLSRLSPGFVRYWSRSPEFVQQLRAMAHGTDMAPYLSLRDQQRLRITLPEISVQQAISSLLGALDDKIAVNDRIAETIQLLGGSLFEQIVAESSPVRSALGEFARQARLVYGDGYRTKRSEHGKPGLPILRVAEVLDGRVEAKLEDFVSDEYRPAMGGKISQPGDVVLTTKGTVGRVAIITPSDPQFVYSPQVCYFRVPDGSPLSSSYIYFWLRSGDFWRQAVPMKSQTDMADYLSLSDIRRLEMPVPGPSQDLSMLDDLVAQIAARQQENRKLAELRDTLLPKLMSGEIRVRDAEKVVEEAVLWRAECRRRGGKTSSWSGSQSWGGSPRTARTSPRDPGSGTPGMS